ncbi:MAG: type II toxin-antitoxin system RelE/ParE family toxin [Gammaproteobacteria bacterium]|nr:type II toxin-antitoxin system RelE/ParE family toxin [Gammaproteobacteria bacterium]MDE0365857.1 type II toxin-antitoxin system RelE/ParE family toxin [Gammaproteobacteria bacterium]
MTRAVLSTAAERDILEIAEWIAVENPAAARGFRAALDTIATTLGDHPRIGALKPELAAPPVRFVPLRGYPYIVVYTPDRDPPLILRVLHGARDLPEILRV